MTLCRKVKSVTFPLLLLASANILYTFQESNEVLQEQHMQGKSLPEDKVQGERSSSSL